MKKFNRNPFARTMLIALISTVSISAQAQDFLKDFKINGFLDAYYGYSFNRPGTNSFLFGRQFDVKHNQFSLAAVQVNAVKAPTDKDHFGITLNLLAGKDADIENSTEPGGVNTYKNLRQAYVTYAAPKGITVDFGKFLTWTGYEVVTAGDDDNYSRSFLFTLGQPIYHMGVRATAPLGTTGATGSLYLVNGWNEVEDSNAGKSIGATLNVPLGAKTNVTLNYYGGMEGSAGVSGIGFFPLPDPNEGPAIVGSSSVQMGDLVVTHQLTPKVKLALNADYASAKGIDAGDPSGKWRGIAGYIKDQFSSQVAGTIRYETFSDTSGLRTGVNSRLNSLTGTLEFAVSPSALFRVELRNDTSNRSLFEDKSGMKDKRTTLTLAHIYKF